MSKSFFISRDLKKTQEWRETFFFPPPSSSDTSSTMKSDERTKETRVRGRKFPAPKRLFKLFKRAKSSLKENANGGLNKNISNDPEMISFTNDCWSLMCWCLYRKGSKGWMNQDFEFSWDFYWAMVTTTTKKSENQEWCEQPNGVHFKRRYLWEGWENLWGWF